MAYRIAGFPRITIRATIGAAVISLKEIILAHFAANTAALFGNAAGQTEFLRHISSWTAVEGFIEHGDSAVPASIFMLTDFREKDGVTNYPTTGTMTANGVELKTNGSRHYFNNIDTDRVLIYCATDPNKISIDLSFEV